MQHLTAEELGRLIDEEATPPESEHLAICAECAAEMEAMRATQAELLALRDPAVPTQLWENVQAQLRSEGLVRGPARAFPFPYALGPGMRAAAGFALFLLGSLTGGVVVAVRSPAADIGPSAATNLVDAAANLRSAEASYLQAVSNYSELADPAEMVDPLNRLTALEGILLTTEAALREAPSDPVINNYHLTALGMRDAMMRQLEDAVPVELAPDGEQWY